MLHYKAFDRFEEFPPDSGQWVNHFRDDAALEAGLLIDATGFDEMAWTKLFTQLRDPLPDNFRASLEMRMGQHLELRGAPWSGQGLVHAPMLSTIVGPGFSNLMCLGSMADRILSAYL
jgi:mycobactin lysine-N-oxygenase